LRAVPLTGQLPLDAASQRRIRRDPAACLAAVEGLKKTLYWQN